MGMVARSLSAFEQSLRGLLNAWRQAPERPVPSDALRKQLRQLDESAAHELQMVAWAVQAAQSVFRIPVPPPTRSTPVACPVVHELSQGVAQLIGCPHPAYHGYIRGLGEDPPLVLMGAGLCHLVCKHAGEGIFPVVRAEDVTPHLVPCVLTHVGGHTTREEALRHLSHVVVQLRNAGISPVVLFNIVTGGFSPV